MGKILRGNWEDIQSGRIFIEATGKIIIRKWDYNCGSWEDTHKKWETGGFS